MPKGGNINLQNMLLYYHLHINLPELSCEQEMIYIPKDTK